MTPVAERFFRDSDYWRAWSQVPDMTADIPYALAALDSTCRRVLDAPCGRGRLLKAVRAALPDAELHGLDVNAGMIHQVQDECPSVHTHVGSVYALPFPDRHFDAVLCHESFMHFDEPRRALAELARVAGRRLYLSVTTRRQLNTLLRRLGLMGSSDVPHWTYDQEDILSFLPTDFTWEVRGAFLVGRKALGLGHARHARLHRLVGRRLPQWLLRRFGQTLFLYGTRVVETR
ncbi:MAG TPA: class I SAM-dependent methyltransferase [Candidatus Bathyarchaeia archaeon]|nr:class I SAM-dependent methyltransferase [Candidatus Bathyarchaeia archaeon]